MVERSSVQLFDPLITHQFVSIKGIAPSFPDFRVGAQADPGACGQWGVAVPPPTAFRSKTALVRLQSATEQNRSALDPALVFNAPTTSPPPYDALFCSRRIVSEHVLPRLPAFLQVTPPPLVRPLVSGYAQITRYSTLV